MNKIYFATSNKNKIREAESILNIKIEPISLEIKEIQSLDIKEVALDKAKKYYEKVKKPLFVEEGGIVLRALKKLPGAYTSDFLKTIGNQGIVKLIDIFPEDFHTKSVVCADKADRFVRPDEFFYPVSHFVCGFVCKSHA